MFGYADDGNFRQGRWVYRLTELSIDQPVVMKNDVSFGNILFFPVDNPRLLVMLQTLLDNCDAPRKVWRD